MLYLIFDICLGVLFLSALLSSYRVAVGPTVADRVLGLDTIAIILIGTIVILSMRLGTLTFLDAALVIAVLGFVGTVAVANFMAKGVVIDRDSG